MAAEDRRREKKINLAALKKLDKFAANILDTASSVAHYVFDAKSEEWVRHAISLLIEWRILGRSEESETLISLCFL